MDNSLFNLQDHSAMRNCQKGNINLVGLIGISVLVWLPGHGDARKFATEVAAMSICGVCSDALLRECKKGAAGGALDGVRVRCAPEGDLVGEWWAPALDNTGYTSSWLVTTEGRASQVVGNETTVPRALRPTETLCVAPGVRRPMAEAVPLAFSPPPRSLEDRGHA